MDKNVTVQQPSEQAVPSVKNNDIGYKQIKNPDGSYKLEMGIAEQSLKKNIHNFMHDHFKIYRDYENLDFISGLQKAIAIGLSTPNNKNIYREYYQIALNFADNNLESNKNDYNNTFTMFQYYKNNDIKNFFKSIIIKSENLNINDAFYNYTINHTMIVTAKDNSPLKNKILKSDTLRSFISNNYNVIKKGKLQGKSISIEFPYDKSDYDKISLYLTLHNALIYNPHIDEKGNLSMDIADYYDFEKLPSSEDLLKNIFIDINNRAYEQQLMGKLKPYILHIHITIPANDLNTIINHTK